MDLPIASSSILYKTRPSAGSQHSWSLRNKRHGMKCLGSWIQRRNRGHPLGSRGVRVITLWSTPALDLDLRFVSQHFLENRLLTLRNRRGPRSPPCVFFATCLDACSPHCREPIVHLAGSRKQTLQEAPLNGHQDYWTCRFRTSIGCKQPLARETPPHGIASSAMNV